jgi:hypothetical protein
MIGDGPHATIGVEKFIRRIKAKKDGKNIVLTIET